MLQVDNKPVAPAGTTDIASLADTFAGFSAFVRRHLFIILVVFATTLGLGFVYLFTTPPSFTAQAMLLIDTRRVQLFQQQSVLGDVAIDSATVESQVEILKSEGIALAVIKELHLNEEPEFVGSGAGLIGALFNSISTLFSSPAPKSEYENLRRAVSVFRGNLLIKRVGLTYVIEINYRSLDPERAAQIANAVADTYVVDQLEAKYQATRRASVWLRNRIGELRDQASIAQRAVLTFKQQNNIVDTGGRLIGDQQLAEINSQLVTARAQVAEAKARLDRINQIIAAKPDKELSGFLSSPDATVSDSLRSEVINKLRTQYLDYAGREAQLTRRVGSNHLAVINIRSLMSELRNAIFDELRRIAETFKSDYEIAKAREDSFQKALDTTVAETQSTSQATIALRELESSAQTYRALYDNFLQRYMEATQQQSFPISEARLISQASRPLGKSHPKTILVLALTGSAGLLLAFGAGMVREFSDRVFRTGAQVETHLRTDCIAVLPVLKPARKSLLERERKPAPNALHPRTLVPDRSILWHVVDNPFSRFAEEIRSIKMAADLYTVAKANKVIGVTSSVPNEGKSTIAFALAQLIAHGGSTVVLIDGDLRNPALTRKLAPNATAGVLDVIAGKAPLNDVIWTDPGSGLVFVPAVFETRLAHTSLRELHEERLAEQLRRCSCSRVRSSRTSHVAHSDPRRYGRNDAGNGGKQQPAPGA